MPDKNKTQPKAFRITEETAEKFKEIAQNLGANQQQALAKLIEVYEMEVGKESIPEMRENIDTFEGYIHAAANMYMQALESNQNMRALVRTEYEAQLKSKDKIIEELQKKVQIAEEIVDKVNKKEKDYLDAIAALDTDKEELQKQIEDKHTEAKKKIEEYNNRYGELKEAFDKIQLSEENFKSMVASFMKECEELKEENKKLQENKTTMEANSLELLQKNEFLLRELDNEKRKIAEESSRLSTEFEHYKENCEIRHLLELQKKENELRENYDKKIEELRKEIDNYKRMYYKIITTKQNDSNMK